MDKDKIPVEYSKKSKPLWDEILTFSRKKYGLAFILVLVGLLGIVVPIIPGILLILFAVALLKPGLMVKVRSKLKSIFK